MRSIVCNPQLVAVCNQSEGLNIQVLRLDDIQFAKRTDYIRLTAITYHSFGLDKKTLVQKNECFLVETTGLEPVTPCMSSKYSNQLSYASIGSKI